jgi:hypothetical protein
MSEMANDEPGDLARRLAADHDGSLRREYESFFDAARTNAHRRLHEALAPDAFATQQALVESTALASEVIAQVAALVQRDSSLSHTADSDAAPS